MLHAFAAYEDKDLWRMIQQGIGGGVVGWGLLTIGELVFSRVVTGFLYLIITIVALTIGLRLPWLTWYCRLKIWLVRRRPIELVAIPAAIEAVRQSADSHRRRDRSSAAGDHQAEEARSGSGAGHAAAAEGRQDRPSRSRRRSNASAFLP